MNQGNAQLVGFGETSRCIFQVEYALQAGMAHMIELTNGAIIRAILLHVDITARHAHQRAVDVVFTDIFGGIDQVIFKLAFLRNVP